MVQVLYVAGVFYIDIALPVPAENEKARMYSTPGLESPVSGL